MAKRIIDDLIREGYIEPAVPEKELLSATEELLLDELMVEDRLNEEVREILREHAPEIEQNRLDYRRLFELTKKRLVRERNLVL